MTEWTEDRRALWEQLDRAASKEQRDTYVDPQTKRLVFTSYYLRKRGYCCSSGCRHCPYAPGRAPAKGRE